VKYGSGHETSPKCSQKVTCGHCEVFYLLQYPHASQFAIQHSPFLKVLPGVQVYQSAPNKGLLCACHPEVSFCFTGPVFLVHSPSQWHPSKPHPLQLSLSRTPIAMVERGACAHPKWHITLITRVRLQTRSSSALCPMDYQTLQKLWRSGVFWRVPAMLDQVPYCENQLELGVLHQRS
jgi:hypothetical protein